MKKQFDDIACRRRMLLHRIAGQRTVLAEISRHWQRPLALADTGLMAVHYIRNHPALLSAGMAAFLAFRNKGITELLRDGWRILLAYPLLKILTSE